MLIFTAPTNLFYKFWEGGSYVHGLQVDYLIGKFYLSQIPLVGLLSLWLGDAKTWDLFRGFWKKARVKIGAVLFLTLGVRQFFTPEPLISLWHWLNFMSIGLFGLFLFENKQQLQRKWIAAALVATILFQSAIGIAQFQLHHELVGFTLLGEPTLSQSIGIATTTISGAERILPYGTTAHPNVLAGYLAIYSLLLLHSSKVRKKVLPILGVAILTIVLTGSLSAMAAVLIGLSVYVLPTRKMQYLFLPIILLVPVLIALTSTHLPNNTSLVRRDYLQQSGIGIFFANPIWGTGLQTTARYVEEFSPASEVVRFTQPPHHVGILLLAETGLLGVGIIVFLLHKKLQPSFLVLAPILALDHYTWTLVPGMLLVCLCILQVCYD